MPELSVASLSSVKVPPIIVKAAQNVPNLRRHPQMLPAVRQSYITTFARSCPRNPATPSCAPLCRVVTLWSWQPPCVSLRSRDVEAFPYDGNRYALASGSGQADQGASQRTTPKRSTSSASRSTQRTRGDWTVRTRLRGGSETRARSVPSALRIR